MTRRPSLPNPLDRNPFHVAEARAAGVSASRLRARDLEKPFHAIRTAAPPATMLSRAMAYLPRMTEHQYFSDITAALLYGVPLPWRLERSTELHVSVDQPHHPPQTKGVRGHLASTSRPIQRVRGMRVLAPADAWCELARSLGHDDLVVAADYLVRRKGPRSSLAELQAAIARLGSRRYVRALRAALNDVRSGTDSPAETRLRLIIAAAGLPEPVVHHEVHDDDGFFVGTPDLAYVAEKIAIEWEGEGHQTDRATYSGDIIRRRMFARAGWTVILIIKEHSPAYIAAQIREALREHAARTSRR